MTAHLALLAVIATSAFSQTSVPATGTAPAAPGGTAPSGTAPATPGVPIAPAPPTTTPVVPPNSTTLLPPGSVLPTTPGTTVPPVADNSIPEIKPLVSEQAAGLKLFGRELFSSTLASSEPNADAPVPPNYVLGAGDVLSILLWSGTTEYERSNNIIAPNGNIYLKLLGSIPLSEKTIAQAQEELRRRYSKFYKQFNLTVEVVGRRTIPIFVVGEVARPGKYTLSSLSTVFSALYAAGGPTDHGSLRQIRLMRQQRLVSEIDVYSYLINGKAVDLQLKAGDTVFVPIADKVVSVSGEVRRPAKYELTAKDNNLGSAVRLAGGVTSQSTERIRLTRVDEASHQRKISELVLSVTAALPLQDGDEIFAVPVLPFTRNAVQLTGAVNRPGEYSIEQAPTVAALLRQADGLTPAAYAEQAMITRLGEGLVRSQITVNLRAIMAGQAGTDVKLEPGDTLQVYNRSELSELLDTVSVMGQVIKPGIYPYKTDMRVRDLLQVAFGPTTKAYLTQAQIFRFRIGEQPELITIDLEKALAGDVANNVLLRPRDQLRVYDRAELPELLDTVTVNGEVTKPGSYPFHTDMRVADLLRSALGVTTKTYLPLAEIYRYGVGTEPAMMTVNIAKALAGDAQNNVVLQPRDRMVVHARADVQDLIVRVEGEVVTPGGIPFFQGMKASEALFAAGGLKPDVALDNALLIRLNPDTFAEELIELSLRDVLARIPGKDILLQNRDRLIVYPISQLGEQRQVRIEGAVAAPGLYPYFGDMRVSNLLFLAKNLNVDAYARRADLYRLRPDNTTEIIPIDLSKAMLGLTSSDNPVLKPQDRLVVSTREQMEEIPLVKIDGYVRRPGPYFLTEGMKLSDLIHLSGGLTPDARPQVDVYRVENGIAHSETIPIKFQEGVAIPEKDMVLQARDLVSVQGNSDFISVTETITMEGMVAHPGVYPAYNENRRHPKTFYQAIKESGGLLPEAYPNGIVLYREQSIIHTNRQQQELNRTLNYLDASVGLNTPVAQAGTTPPATGTAPPTTGTAPPTTATTPPTGTTTGTTPPTTGTTTGTTPVATGTTLSATGTTPSGSAIPVEATATTLNQANAQNINNISRSLAQVISTDNGDTVVLVSPPRSMQEQKFSLTLPVDAKTVVNSNGTVGDFVLQPGDVLYVPERPTTVTVLGGVINNGSLVFQEGQNLNYYLNLAGGTAPDGEAKRIVVMRLNGRVVPLKQVKAIEPGDIIIVPTKFIINSIHTKNGFQRALQSISETALSVFSISKLIK